MKPNHQPSTPSTRAAGRMVTRRALLCAGVAGVGFAAAGAPARGAESAKPAPSAAPIPLLDLHVHLDNSTIDRVADLSRRLGVRFGVVEHAGTRENKYPVILSTDDELRRWLEMLEGKGVYRGVQAEWTDWAGCFSHAMLARLDYVLTDAMTFPGKDGRRVKLWEKDVADRVDLADPEKFMNRFVDWHLEIVERQPIDILANTSWLPAPLAAQYDRLWTPARVRRVAEAAAKHGVALEISSGYRLPKLPFLRIAREAGVKFSFGSNGRYPNMGKIDYCLAVVKELGLSAADLFTPVPKAK